MMKSALQIARDLTPTITRLDALVTPLAHGGRDGHGTPIASQAELQQRLLAAVRDAQQALARAHRELTTEPYQENPS